MSNVIKFADVMSYRRRRRIEQHSSRGGRGGNEQQIDDERPDERVDSSAAPLLHGDPDHRPSTSYASINVIFHDTS